MTCRIKRDPSKLPKPILPTTKAVDIGTDKMCFVPIVENKSEATHNGDWAEKDERILVKLKLNGTKDKDIARKMGRTLNSVKWRVRVLKKRGVLP